MEKMLTGIKTVYIIRFKPKHSLNSKTFINSLNFINNLLIQHVVHIVDSQIALEALHGCILVDTYHLDACDLCIVFPIFGSDVI